jgi:acylphosphatase
MCVVDLPVARPFVTDANMLCRRYVVQGLVQGVFYRVTAQQTAQRLGLKGWVRNQADGSVELIACGPPAKLDQLERWLWQGPPHAKVEEVVTNEVAAQSFSAFDIVH